MKTILPDGTVEDVGGPGGSTPVYVQVEDPGAVGVGKLWIDISGAIPLAFIRDTTDEGWQPLGQAVGAVNTNGGDVDTAGGYIHMDGGHILTNGGSVDTAGGDLTFGDAGIELDTNRLKITGNAPTLFDSGINAGEYPIVNVADGTDPTDAANVGQLTP